MKQVTTAGKLPHSLSITFLHSFFHAERTFKTTMSQLSYAIIGTGAIGGYYGAKLQQSGCDVHFLLRSDYELVKKQGLSVASINGDIELPSVRAYNHSGDMPSVDVAIVALKTTQTSQTRKLLPVINPGGAVLCLQNGLGVEKAIEQQLAGQVKESVEIIGGLCFIGALKSGPGQIEHTDYGHVLLGPYQADEQRCEPTPLMDKIAEDFTEAGVEINLTDDLPMARWKKLVWNVPYNGLSVILNATTEEMMSDSGVRSLISTLMRETVAIANTWAKKASPQEDRALSLKIVEDMLSHTKTMAAYQTSMKVDFDRGHLLEIEAILGNPLKIAHQYGVPAPTMTMLYQQLTFIQQRIMSP